MHFKNGRSRIPLRSIRATGRGARVGETEKEQSEALLPPNAR
ncbi:hypothetical protein CBNA_1595 [Coxiella burnetii str. Namibia]|nr:hypothetical protein CBNA_1595 [Coxiella burnetii str. Namibia]